MEVSASPKNQKPIHHDIFEDPAITKALKEDPLFRFLTRTWKFLLVVALVVGAAWYVKFRFEEASLARLGEGRQRLVAVHEAYDAAVNELSKPKPTASAGTENNAQSAAKRLSESRQVLSDAPEPYGSLAHLYRSLEVRAGAAALNPEDPNFRHWESVPTQEVRARLTSELEALALARVAIDNDATLEMGRKVLEALAERGEYAQASAVVTLRRIAKSDAEKARAEELIASVNQRFPEQSDLIKKELERIEG